MKIFTIIENLKALTLLETSKLVKQIENIFGVSGIIIQTNTSLITEPTSNADKIEEKNTFDIILEEAPSDKRISILKIVRNVTGLGLKESKEIVDNVPKVIKEGITKEECETIKKELESSGARITIK